MQSVRQAVMGFMERTVWQVTHYWKHLCLPRQQRKDITEHPSKAETVEVDLSKYQNEEQREKENEQLVLDEIKRKDRSFYDQWCNDEN